MSERMTGSGFWYGDHWPTIDAFVYLRYSNAGKGVVPFGDYPSLVANGKSVRARPSFQRSAASL